MTELRKEFGSPRTSVGSVLLRAAAINSKNQHVKFVLLDLFWRSVWLAGTAVVLVIFWMLLMSHLASFEWVGPDLGGTEPIMVIAALRTFWRTFGATLIFELVLVLATSVGLWIVLEALFRGGRRSFWIYLGTSAARVAFLSGTVFIFGVFAAQDEGVGTLVVGGVFVMALVFALAVVESVVRRNAVDLLAVDLMGVAGVIGALLSIEGLLAFFLFGFMAAALLSASGGVEVILALTVCVVAGLFWMVVHSYLIAVRYEAIDIMRQHVVGQ